MPDVLINTQKKLQEYQKPTSVQIVKLIHPKPVRMHLTSTVAFGENSYLNCCLANFEYLIDKE